MSQTRLHAPTENGATLADPPLDDAARLVRENQTLLAGWSHDFQGRSAARVRAMTRAAVLAAANGYTGNPTDPRSAINNQQSLIVSGHQPELFHPGVWVKNFAAHGIARRCGGVPLHLVVDTDTVKQTTARVPTGSMARPSVVHVPFDRWRGEIPFEEYDVADEAAFASFGRRVREALEPLGVRPLAETFWKLAVSSATETPRLGERIARARRQQEVAWGARSLELPISRLCQTEGFFWFAAHVLAQLSRFREAYNAVLDDYRRARRIRSQNHPVPSLARDGEWLEAPFRVWTRDHPRRRPLFVRQDSQELVLTDRDQWTARLPLTPDRDARCAVEALEQLARSGVKLRTRALTTTIFTRLCLAELFIHGLGGALYDEVANAVIERFFGVRPPRFLTLTGTLHLPIASHAASDEDARTLRRLARDFDYNPDRHLDMTGSLPTEIFQAVERKRQLVRSDPVSRGERRERFHEIRRLNQAIAPAVASLRSVTLERLEHAEAGVAARAILRNREWAFCLYPEETLLTFLRPFLWSALA